MTTDIELTSQYWPFRASEMDKERVRFEPIEATVAYVYRSDRGPAYRFEEDQTEEVGKDGKVYTGCLWGLKGEYDETTRTFSVAPDPGFDKGDSVIVRLAMRKRGTAIYRDCMNIRPGTAPKQAPGAPQSVGNAEGVVGHPRDATRLSIEKQQAFIGQTAVVCAMLTAGEVDMPHSLGDKQLALWEQMRDVLWGDPSPLVTAALDMGATNPTEVEDTWELPADDGA